jgi:hypothetical protein
MSDSRRGSGSVASNHDGEYAQGAQLVQKFRRIGARRIAERDEPDQLKRILRPSGHGKRSISRPSERVQLCRSCRRLERNRRQPYSRISSDRAVTDSQPALGDNGLRRRVSN